MTDLTVPTKTVGERILAVLKKTNDEWFSDRLRRRTQFVIGAVLILLVGFGGFGLSMYRHETQFIPIPKAPAGGWDQSSEFVLREWPVKPPYADAHSTGRLKEIEMELYHHMDERPSISCLHAASLGVPVDTMVIRLGDALYIMRDVVGIEYVGDPVGAYHSSIMVYKQIAFAYLYNELRLEFISMNKFKSTMKDIGTIKSPYHVTNQKLAQCIQLYYPKQ